MAGGAQQTDDDEPITSINIVPLVDIVLVVLIIFLLTASYIVTPAIHVDLPKAATGEPTPQTMLSLVITREGDMFLNSAKISQSDLRAFIRAAVADGKKPEAIIAADASVSYGRVAQTIDLVKEEGIESVSLNTERDFSSVPSPPPEPRDRSEVGGR